MFRQIVLAAACLMCLTLVTSATGTESPDPLTVSLDTALHFIAPDGSDVIVGPGIYRIEQMAASELRLIPGQGPALSVRAVTLTHDEQLTTPIALSLAGGQDLYHLILLLPDGRRVESTGSKTGVTSRAPGEQTLALSPLKQAVILKNQAVIDPTRVTPNLPAAPPPPPPFCERLKADPNLDRDPSVWRANMERRKVEYQLATINEQFMGNTKNELMLGLPPFPADALFRRLPPDLRDDNGRLASRLSLAARREREKTGNNIWPWEIGWNDEKFKAWRATHPADDPILTWWRAQFKGRKDDKPVLDDMETLENNTDFQASERIRVLYLLPTAPSTDKNVPEDIRLVVERSFQHFKYWIDEPFSDNADGEMTFWSENHQILFASVEFLAAQYLQQHHPNWIFRDGKTAEQHLAKVRPRLLRWLNDRLRFGFNEWNSSSYYNFDIFPLLNLVDFSQDQEVRARANMVLDLMLFDLARFTQKGNFAATAGRAYPEAKITGWDQSVGDLVQIVFGTRCPTDPIYRNRFGDRQWSGNADSAHAFASSTYQVPMVILAIGHNWQIPFPTIDRSRVSLNFGEAEDYGVAFDNFEDVMFWWGRGAYLAKYTVRTSLEMMNSYNLWTQHDFKDYADMLKPLLIGQKILRDKPAAETIMNKLSFLTEGMALTRGNLYTYRNEDVMLSSVQNFRKEEMGPQLQAWQATFDNDVVVFSTYPSPEGGGHDGPNWWAGNAVNPRIVQYEDALIAAYAPDVGARQARSLISKKLSFDPQTHIWFPKDTHLWIELDKDKAGQPQRWADGKLRWRPRKFFDDTYVEHAAQGRLDEFAEERVHGANVDGVWYFGRRGKGYIGVFSAQHDCALTGPRKDPNKDSTWIAEFRRQEAANIADAVQETSDWAGKEVLCPGLRNVFIVQVGNERKFGPFENFKSEVKKARINISKGVRDPALPFADVEASYDIPRGQRLELHYDKDPRLDGKPLCDDDFPRFENPYTLQNPKKRIEWGQRQYTIQHGPYKLFHDQDQAIRSGDGL